MNHKTSTSSSSQGGKLQMGSVTTETSSQNDYVLEFSPTSKEISALCLLPLTVLTNLGPPWSLDASCPCRNKLGGGSGYRVSDNLTPKLWNFWQTASVSTKQRRESSTVKVQK
jgi:hypothetical protein